LTNSLGSPAGLSRNAAAGPAPGGRHLHGRFEAGARVPKLNIVVMSGSLTGPLPAHTTFLHKRFSPVSFLQAVRKLRLATVLSTGQRVYQCVECDRVEVD
jgi:hypothetical protein